VVDARGLDRTSAQPVGFVARRLSVQSVALVFAARTAGDERELAGLPELLVEGLSEGAARALPDSAIQEVPGVHARNSESRRPLP
jgi:hypothetical protein